VPEKIKTIFFFSFFQLLIVIKVNEQQGLYLTTPQGRGARDLSLSIAPNV
jgi:hypothetical protein